MPILIFLWAQFSQLITKLFPSHFDVSLDIFGFLIGGSLVIRQAFYVLISEFLAFLTNSTLEEKVPD